MSDQFRALYEALPKEQGGKLVELLRAGGGRAMGRTTYGFEIKWGDRTYKSHGYATFEAMAAARREEFDRMAREDGWTQPRWWQFWRINDTRRGGAPSDA